MQQSSDQKRYVLKASDQPSDISGSFILPFYTDTHTHSGAIVWNNEVVLNQMDHQVFVD